MKMNKLTNTLNNQRWKYNRYKISYYIYSTQTYNNSCRSIKYNSI